MNTKFSIIDKRLIATLSFFYLLLFIVVLLFYFLSPFNNKCIKGDCENGYGIFRYYSGIKYSGEWMNGMRHGKGTLIHPDGSKYIGNWKNDRFHGHGTKTYIHKWKNYRDNGKVYTTSSIYSGEWKNGRKDGKGELLSIITGKITGIKSSRYTGDWKNGNRHGYGTYIKPNGVVQKGIWVNNKFIKEN